MPTLPQAIDLYLRYLSAERNLAPRTVEAYRFELLRFLSFVDSQARPLRDVDSWLLKDFIATRKEEADLKATTLSRTISALRSFFRWVTREGFIDVDPALPLRSPKKPQKLPIYLAEREAQGLCHAGIPEDQPEAPRDRLIVMMLLLTGMRLSELVGLDLEHYSGAGGTLRVFGKGRKERLIPLAGVLRTAIAEYLQKHRPSTPCRALLLSRKGDRLSRRTVQYVVHKAVRRKGLDRRISPHKLRHTFATHLYGNGTSLRDIQALLGHSSIASTSIYTHTDVDRLRGAVNRLKF
jgi:integrase/recombinase XerC